MISLREREARLLHLANKLLKEIMIKRDSQDISTWSRSVYKVLKLYNETETIEIKRIGKYVRKHKTTSRDVTMLLRKSTENPQVSKFYLQKFWKILMLM